MNEILFLMKKYLIKKKAETEYLLERILSVIFEETLARFLNFATLGNGCFFRNPSCLKSEKPLKSRLWAEMLAFNKGIKLRSAALSLPAENASCLDSSNCSSLGTYIGSGFSIRVSAWISAEYTYNGRASDIQIHTHSSWFRSYILSV